MTGLKGLLTHRDHAHGVVFVASHAKSGDEGLDWAPPVSTAAQAKLTLAICMGVAGSEQIQAELLLGRAVSIPVATS